MSALIKSSAVVLSSMEEYADKIKAIDKKAKDYTGGHVKVSTNDKYQVTLYFGFDKNKNSKSIQFPIGKEDASIWFESLELFNDEFVKTMKSRKVKSVDAECTFTMNDFLKDDNTDEDKSEDEQSSANQDVTKTDTVIIAKTSKPSAVGSINESLSLAKFHEEQEADNDKKLQEVEEFHYEEN